MFRILPLTQRIKSALLTQCRIHAPEVGRNCSTIVFKSLCGRIQTQNTQQSKQIVVPQHRQNVSAGISKIMVQQTSSGVKTTTGFTKLSKQQCSRLFAIIRCFIPIVRGHNHSLRCENAHVLEEFGIVNYDFEINYNRKHMAKFWSLEMSLSK